MLAGVFKNPVTCVPCGHSLCLKCLQEHSQGDYAECVECGGTQIEGFVESRALDGLCSKHDYKISTLRNLDKRLSSSKFGFEIQNLPSGKDNFK